jgi:hypothetical protein
VKKMKLHFVEYERLIMHSLGFHLYLDIDAGKQFETLTQRVMGT